MFIFTNNYFFVSLNPSEGNIVTDSEHSYGIEKKEIDALMDGVEVSKRIHVYMYNESMMCVYTTNVMGFSPFIMTQLAYTTHNFPSL